MKNLIKTKDCRLTKNKKSDSITDNNLSNYNINVITKDNINDILGQKIYVRDNKGYRIVDDNERLIVSDYGTVCKDIIKNAQKTISKPQKVLKKHNIKTYNDGTVGKNSVKN